MELRSMACDHCGYRLDRRDLEYGSCPACGSAIEGYEGIRETDSLGYTEIKDGNGKVVGKARLPRGFSTALATFTKDSSDKVRPNKMTVISESLDNSKLFYKSGECFLQVKNGLFNQGKGELGKDLSARKKNFKTPSEYLDEMAGKITGATGRLHEQYTRTFPIEDVDNVRNVYLNASIADLKKAQNANHGTKFTLLDFYFDSLIKVYSYDIGNTVRYITLGTVIRGDEVSVALTTAEGMARNMDSAREITGTVAAITNCLPIFNKGIFSVGGTVNMANRVLNSGLVEGLHKMSAPQATEDDDSLASPLATDNSNEGFGTRKKGDSRISYISWNSDCLIGLMSDNRPSPEEMDEFEEFISSFTYTGDIEL